MVLRLLRRSVPPGGSVLDVGAGVNPLAPMLSLLDFKVTTVDPGPTVGPLHERERWNDWGYLDYAHLGLDVTSVNGRLADLPAALDFDAVFSVSVIEHLHARERRALLSDIRSRCRQGGQAVLTVDVHAGSDVLWNRCAGVEVESAAEHGRWADLLDEVATAGFEIADEGITRLGGRSDVDVGYIVARPAATAGRV
jgi:SAM-dependent methyltransferase